MALYKKPDGPFWWADIRIDGKRHRVSTKQKSKQKAQQVENALIQKLDSGTILTARQRAPLLRDFAQEFLGYVGQGRLADKTKEYYCNGWRLLSVCPISAMRLDAITTADIEIVSVPGSGSNVNCALRTLRRMLSLAEQKRLIQRVPRVPLVVENERKQLIDGTVESIILRNAPRTIRDVYLLVADCGIRPDDACSLRWEDVDFVRGDLFIRGGKTGRKAQRYVPISSRVREMLVARAALSNTWVFASKRRPGQAMPARSISTRASAFKKRVGLPAGVVLYSARHTFATDLTEATGNLVKTQKALGHTSLSTTARYNHSRSADIAAIMDARNSERHVLSHGESLIQ